MNYVLLTVKCQQITTNSFIQVFAVCNSSMFLFKQISEQICCLQMCNTKNICNLRLLRLLRLLKYLKLHPNYISNWVIITNRLKIITKKPLMTSHDFLLLFGTPTFRVSASSLHLWIFSFPLKFHIQHTLSNISTIPLCTDPNHLNLASLSFPLIYSFIILPILPSPQEIISIFHSATSSSASYAFVSVNTFVTNNKKT